MFLLIFSEVCFWSRSSQGSSLRHCGVFHWSMGRTIDTIRWKGWYYTAIISHKCILQALYFVVGWHESRVTPLSKDIGIWTYLFCDKRKPKENLSSFTVYIIGKVKAYKHYWLFLYKELICRGALENFLKFPLRKQC